MIIQATRNPRNAKTLEDLTLYCAQSFGDIIGLVNGNIDFVENCSTRVMSVVVNSVNTDVAVPHNLNHPTKGYIVIGQSADMGVYDGIKPPTTSTIYIRAAVKGTAKLLIF